MEQEYWNTFMKTGQVADYLSYKCSSACEENLNQNEEKERESVTNSYRDGAIGDADGRI